jgi:predicted ABC-type exoprotein transport system permease subunit
MRTLRHGTPLDIIAAVAVTLLCIGVIITFIVSADPVWLIADTTAIFAFGVWLLWRHTLN